MFYRSDEYDGWESDYYSYRMSSYRDQITSWKKDSDNMVHPAVISKWSDNSIADEVKVNGYRLISVVPGNICGDLYRLMFHDDAQITKPENGKEFWFDLISSLPIFGLAMQTNGSHYWSKVAAIAFAKSILKELQNQNPPGANEDGNQWMKRLKEMIQKAMDGQDANAQKAIRDAMENGFEEANQDIQKQKNALRELGLDPEQIDTMAGKGSMELKFLEQRQDLIDALYFNTSKATEFIKSTSKFFRSTVGKPKAVRTPFIDADSFHDIINPETFLFPFQIVDTVVTSYEKSAKVDVYIDRSGSMGAQISSKTGGKTIKVIDAATIFAYKLQRMGIVDKVYTFDDEVREVPSNQTLFIGLGGGTCFTEVVRHFKEQKKLGSKKLGFVITDGCDDTELLDKDLSWMFVEGGPGSRMAKLYSQDSMRIWSRGEIMKISQWKGRR